MGTVYRETYSKPLPPDAERFARKGEAFARWRDGRGRKRTAKLNAAGDRVLIESGVYTAKYRDGAGLLCKVSTGCRTLDAARAVLAELEKRADKVRAGITTAAEDSVLDHQTTPLAEHVEAYLDHLRHKRGKGGKPTVARRHVANVEKALNTIADACDFVLLRDVNRKSVERWTAKQAEAGTRSPRTINAYLRAMCAFGNWCVETGRIAANPLARPPKLDESTDTRHARRALTDAELSRLLYAARRRPLAEHGRETVALPADKRKGRKTWTKAPLTPDTIEAAAERARDALADKPDFIAELERTGRERALVYKALTLTGLRKGELASLTVGQLELEPGPGKTCYATLHAADAKSGTGADVPLRDDLAGDLRAWLADKLRAAQDAARLRIDEPMPMPMKLPHDAKLFDVPAGLIRIFDRDAEAAGIAKRDDRGRVVDVHSLRHTFGSLLSRGGVAPRTAQAAMRHSKLDLTMSVYTDPRLLDVAGAMDVLPSLPLDDSPQRERAKATGTDAAEHVPMHVPTSGNQRTQAATAGNTDRAGRHAETLASVADGGGCHSLTREGEKRVTGLEPATFSLEG